MKLLSLGIVGLLGLQLVGCASVSNGTTQAIRLETLTADGKTVEGAQCSLTNDSGSFNVTTPGSVLVHRSSANLNIICKKMLTTQHQRQLYRELLAACLAILFSVAVSAQS